MSKEVLEIVQGMDLGNIETQLALQCAPLIMGFKISNLLIVPSDNEKLVKAILKRTGISYYRLLRTEKKITFLLFRRKQMEIFLEKNDVREVFIMKGYQKFYFEEILSTFQKRYQAYMDGRELFPHEMGLLLGYPVEDVKGFIENEGRNFLYSGYWKVYADMSEKIKLFQKFEFAKETIIQLVSSGVSIEDIIKIYSKRAF